MQSLSHGEYSPNPLAEDRGGVGGIGTGSDMVARVEVLKFPKLEKCCIVVV